MVEDGFNPIAGCDADAASVAVNHCGSEDECRAYAAKRNLCQVGRSLHLTPSETDPTKYLVTCRASAGGGVGDGSGSPSAPPAPPSEGGEQHPGSPSPASGAISFDDHEALLSNVKRASGVVSILMACVTLYLVGRYARFRPIALAGTLSAVSGVVCYLAIVHLNVLEQVRKQRDEHPCPLGDRFDVGVRHCVPIGYGDKCDARQLGGQTCTTGFVCHDGTCMLPAKSRNDGEGCRFDDECYSGKCHVRKGDYQGFCKPSKLSSCSRAQSYDKSFRACVPADGYGAVCNPTDTRPCSGGYVCDPTAKRCLVSKREGKDGASCLSDAECYSGSCAFDTKDRVRRGVCSFGPAAMCAEDEELRGSACVPSGYAKACNASKTASPCAQGLVCERSGSHGRSTCRRPARSLDDGAACVYNDECASLKCNKKNAVTGGLGFCAHTPVSKCANGMVLYNGVCVVAGYMGKCDKAAVDACPSPLQCVDTVEQGMRCTYPYRSRVDAEPPRDGHPPSGPSPSPSPAPPPAAFSLRSAGGAGGAHVEYDAPSASSGTSWSCTVNEECASLKCAHGDGTGPGRCVTTPSSLCGKAERSVRDVCLPVLYDTSCSRDDPGACESNDGQNDANAPPSASLACVRTSQGERCVRAKNSLPDAHLCLHDAECMSEKCRILNRTEMGFCHPTKMSECRQAPDQEGATNAYEYNPKYRECLPVGYGSVCDDDHSSHCAGLTCALSELGHRCMMPTKSLPDSAECGFDYECASGKCAGNDIRRRVRGLCATSAAGSCAADETYVRPIDMCVPEAYASPCQIDGDCASDVLSCVPNNVGGKSSCRFTPKSQLIAQKCTHDSECVTGKCTNFNGDQRHGVCAIDA